MALWSWLKFGVALCFHDWQKRVNSLFCTGHGFLGNNCHDSNKTSTNTSPGESAWSKTITIGRFPLTCFKRDLKLRAKNTSSGNTVCGFWKLSNIAGKKCIHLHEFFFFFFDKAIILTIETEMHFSHSIQHHDCGGGCSGNPARNIGSQRSEWLSQEEKCQL